MSGGLKFFPWRGYALTPVAVLQLGAFCVVLRQILRALQRPMILSSLVFRFRLRRSVLFRRYSCFLPPEISSSAPICEICG